MKILLVPDHLGWAFDNRAKDLLALKRNGIRFYLKYQSEVKASDQNKYDLIYPLSLSIARKLNKTGIPFNKMATGITSIRVYEKQMIDKNNFKPEFLKLIKELRGINAWSDEIVQTFKPHTPIYKTRIGIDTDLFKPGKRRKKESDVFTVGWVGRIDEVAHRELKGYDIVLQALKGLNVKLDIRTFKEHYVPRAKMVEFYQGLDCFICSSRSEGLPNPVLEAAACGVPIITTKVGIIPELIQNKKNGIIIPRTPEAIRKQVKYLIQHPVERQKLGVKIRETILGSWTWDICKKDWEAFFKSVV
ncbi:MAG: glycosyltransferase family 4 protein [Bacillota bacterium]